MLDPAGKPTPRLRASVLREEPEGRLQHMQQLESWIKESAGSAMSACAPMRSPWRSKTCGDPLCRMRHDVLSGWSTALP